MGSDAFARGIVAFFLAPGETTFMVAGLAADRTFGAAMDPAGTIALLVTALPVYGLRIGFAL
jgi:hypothetical protein